MINPAIAKLKEQIILEEFTVKSAILGLEIALDSAQRTGRVNIDSFLELLAHAEKAQAKRENLRGQLFATLIDASQKLCGESPR